MKLLEGKITVVTGATRGIGREIAEEFARQGATVIFTYRSSVEKAKELEDTLTGYGATAESYQVDAGDLEGIQKMADEIFAKYGQVDAIVNNAGITQDNLLLRMTEEQWESVIQTNLNSIFYMTKAFLKNMLRKRTGSFINISSVVGITGNAGQANYAASKAGMIGFTKSLAKEVG
ncbi:MAG: SDR family NAD(P)-dependent oxidoreductase, partial [Bacteroidetes bacterium]|nr:SDR family NAD(P)-dependent oxidoreductase [Bacteroidota bacterium]